MEDTEFDELVGNTSYKSPVVNLPVICKTQ